MVKQLLFMLVVSIALSGCAGMKTTEYKIDDQQRAEIMKGDAVKFDQRTICCNPAPMEFSKNTQDGVKVCVTRNKEHDCYEHLSKLVGDRLSAMGVKVSDSAKPELYLAFGYGYGDQPIYDFKTRENAEAHLTSDNVISVDEDKLYDPPTALGFVGQVAGVILMAHAGGLNSVQADSALMQINTPVEKRKPVHHIFTESYCLKTDADACGAFGNWVIRNYRYIGPLNLHESFNEVFDQAIADTIQDIKSN